MVELIFWPESGQRRRLCFPIRTPPRLTKSRETLPALALLPGTAAPTPLPNDLIFLARYKSVWLSLAVSAPPSEDIKHPGMEIRESRQQQDEAGLLKSFPCLGTQFQPVAGAASVELDPGISLLLLLPSARRQHHQGETGNQSSRNRCGGRRCFPGETPSVTFPSLGDIPVLSWSW